MPMTLGNARDLVHYVDAQTPVLLHPPLQQSLPVRHSPPDGTHPAPESEPLLPPLLLPPLLLPPPLLLLPLPQ
jgi:hypothetical protein